MVDAGGLPEAAAELAQALRTPRLVACVADGAIGPWANPGEGRLDDFCAVFVLKIDTIIVLFRVVEL